MNNKKLNQIARKIIDIENLTTSDNNVTLNASKIENLVKECSLEDLLKIDEIIQEKYLTN